MHVAVNPEDGPPGHEDRQQPAPVARGGGGEPPDERQELRRRGAGPRLHRAPRRRQGDTGERHDRARVTQLLAAYTASSRHRSFLSS